MTKPQARMILMNFVRRLRNCGMSWADVEDNFGLQLGLESEEEAEAFALVGDVYKHMVTYVYSFERPTRGSW